MTVPKGQPTPRALKLAIGVIGGRIDDDQEPAVAAAFATLNLVYAAYEAGKLDWCDELVKVRQPRLDPNDQPGGYGGYKSPALSAIADLEDLTRRYLEESNQERRP